MINLDPGRAAWNPHLEKTHQTFGRISHPLQTEDLDAWFNIQHKERWLECIVECMVLSQWNLLVLLLHDNMCVCIYMYIYIYIYVHIYILWKTEREGERDGLSCLRDNGADFDSQDRVNEWLLNGGKQAGHMLMADQRLMLCQSSSSFVPSTFILSFCFG
jgi:hypothetical protein